MKEKVKDFYISLKDKNIFEVTINDGFNRLPSNKLVSSELLSLMKDWLSYDPNKRPEAEAVFSKLKKIIPDLLYVNQNNIF